MTSSETIRLLILGTGGMAGQHALHFGTMEGVEVVAGVDLDEERLGAFCDKHGIDNRFTSIEKALAWDGFDAVANVTPDSVHHATTLRMLAAGKHVFCEKPLATNHPDAAEMAEVAAKAGLVGMVNLTYRNVPALQKAREMVLAGEIGAVRHVEASYLQSWLSAQHWGDWRSESKWLWRLSREHGSNGVLGDIGIHIVDFASYGAGAEVEDVYCRLKTFHKADNDRIGTYVLDANDSFVMTVDFANGALGTIHASRWATGHADDLRLRIFGEKGGLELDYCAQARKERVSTLRACVGEDIQTQTWQTIPAEPVDTNYRRFIEAIRQGGTQEPSFAHAANIQHILDRAIAMEGTSIGSAAVLGA